MSYIGESITASLIVLAIFAAMILFVIGIACLYYGAILFVLLTIIKWFGIISLAAVV